MSNSMLGIQGVYQASVTSSGNSTSATLAGGATFTGVGEFNSFPDMFVSCKSDVAGTLYVDFSIDDGRNYDSTLTYQTAAETNEFHTIVKGARTVRVRYVNGSAAQSYFRLQTEYGTFRTPNSSLNSVVGDDADAVVTRSMTEESLTVEGKYQGRAIIQKFGTNTDIDTASVPEDVWDGGGVYTGFPTGTAQTITLHSSSGLDTATGTGARTVSMLGLDANYAIQSGTYTLTGTTGTTTTTTWTRMHRILTMTAGSSNTNVGTVTAVWSGATTTVFAAMASGIGVGRNAVYTVPANTTGYLTSYQASFGDNTSNNGQFVIWMRQFGGAEWSSNQFFMQTGTPYVRQIYGGIGLPEKTDIAVRCIQINTNNGNVSANFTVKTVQAV